MSKGTRTVLRGGGDGNVVPLTRPLRARKKAEDHLPQLLPDIRAIVDSQSQADPQFRTRRLYTRLTAGEVRRP